MEKHKIVIVDDHTLFSNSLKKLIETYQDYEVIRQLKNGEELKNYLSKTSVIPDLILLDVNMPVLNGKETMKWVNEAYPDYKVLALSMDDNDTTIISMLRNGAKGYILKDIDPVNFREALDQTIKTGQYYTQKVSQTLFNQIVKPESSKSNFSFKEREIEFLEHVCSEKTYKEIAQEMFLSPKTVDGYRENMFKKLEIRSRVGLAMFAIKHGIVKI